jgi:chemotaxis protein MotB
MIDYTPPRQSMPLARGVAVVVLVTLTSLGCVSKGQYNEVVSERDQIAQQRDDLALANRSLAEELGESEEVATGLAEELDSEREEFQDTRATYDMILAELSVEVTSGQIAVEQMETGVKVQIPGDVLFPSGSARLSDSGRSVISRLAKELLDTRYQIVVAGFSDNMPIGGKLADTYPTNWHLAAARASNVLEVIEAGGVPSEQLVAVSFAANQPVASNETAEGRAGNRRIEVRIRPVRIDGRVTD